jgi:hypothetical protein
LFPGRKTKPRFFGYPDRSLDTKHVIPALLFGGS